MTSKTMPGKISISYTWSGGREAAIFFTGLKEKRIMGLRCPSCKGVMVPPHPVCGRCFVRAEEWVGVGQSGRAISPVTYMLEFPGQPRKPPFSISQIMLDGADTPIVHLLDEIGDKSLKSGLRVKAVWAEKRTGSMEDIKYFAPDMIK